MDTGNSTTIPIKYNKSNRKLIARTLSFNAADINRSDSTIDDPGTITVTDHEMVTGQRVILTANTAIAGLTNDEEYFVYVVDKDKIKLCANRFETKQSRPKFVTVGSAGTGGVFNLVNPPLEFYRNGTVVFDLSDPSLSFI